MKKKLFSVLLVLALLLTVLVVAVQADTATPEQLAAAGQTVVDEADNLNFSSSYCPACGRNDVTWTAFSSTYKDFVDGEHIYLTKNVDATSSGETVFIAQKAGITACIHLNGYSITASTKRALIVDAGATVNIMDRKGSSAVITGGYQSKYGVAVYVKNSSTLNLYGGNYTKVANNENPVLYVTGSVVNVHGNTKFECGTGTQPGVFITGGAAFNLYSGSITGGNNTGGYGGNVRVYGGAFNMYGGSVFGGRASSGGDDIYVTEGSFKMTGGNIAGEVAIASSANATVELSGSPVITGKGLVLPKGKTMTLGEFTDKASITIKTNGAFISSNGAAYAPYFKAAVPTDFVEEKEGKLYYFSNDKLTTKTSGEVTAWCPACKADKTWIALSGNGTKYLSNKHYYLASDIATSDYDGALKTSSANSGTSCVHLNGYNIIKTDNHRAVYVTLGTLNIMGNGIVQANYQNEYGCTVYMNAAATLNLYGGTYQKADGNAYPIIRTTKGVLNMYGGATVDGRDQASSYANVHVTSTFNMYGGVIKNGNRSSGNGGNLYVASGKTTLAGGEITDGYSASQGGNIMIEGGSIEIAGTKITGGKAGSAGGNLCINGYSVTMKSGVIENGEAPSGGNVYMTGTNNASLNMSGGIIQNGTATNGYGGNVYIYRGMLTVGANAALVGGEAKYSGGSVSLNNASGNVAKLELYGSITGGKAGKGGNISALNTDSTVTMYDGALISGGEGTDTGNDSDDSWTVGNVLIKKGTFNMKGGVIKDGISTKVSKNVHLNIGGKFNMSGGIVYGNCDETSYTAGSAIRAHAYNSVVTLSGDAKVIREDGKHTGVMRCYGNKLVIETGWSGEASVTWYSTNAYEAGDAIDTTRCEIKGAFSGKLVYEDLAEKPWIHADGNGGAKVADKKLIAGNSITWPADILTAHKNAPDSYIQLAANATLDVPAGEFAYVDLAGKVLTVTGTGTVYGMNSQNCVDGVFDADAPGKIVTDTAFVAPSANSAAGIYVALTDENGETSFHLLNMKLTSLSLNTKRSALYYTAQYLCDEKLAAKVTDYGISYSLLKMPTYGSDYGIDASMWEKSGGKLLQTAVPYMVYDILKAGEDNAVRGKDPIYANPYIKMGDTVIMADITTGDTVNDAGFDGIGKSLYDLMVYHDQAPIYNALNENQKTNLNRYYTGFYEDIKVWNFRNITVEYDSSNLKLSGNTAACPVCGESVTWTQITGDSAVTLEDGGHYYLESNVTFTGTNANGFVSAPASGTACLHLNGRNLTATNARAVDVNGGKLNIMGKGNVSGNASDSGGATLFVRGSGELNLYGGTYVKAAANTDRPIVDLYAGTVNMYRVTTIDGAGQSSATAPGCVLLESDKAVFNLYGGVIKNGNGKGNAGNVRLGSGSTFNMYGGSVINGVTGGDGGNFYIEKGSLNISGGVITGAEIYAKDANGTVELSGAPQIDYLTLHSGQLVTLGEMTDGASVKVNTNGPFTTYNEKAADYAKYFSTMTNAAKVEAKDGVLHYTKQYLSNLEFVAGTQQAVCPACDKLVTWKPVSADVAAEDGKGSYELKNGDHYYLPQDIVHTGAGWSSFFWAPRSYGMVGCVHLNGHNLTITNGRAIQGSAGQLNVMGQGVVTGDYAYTTSTTHGSTVNINTGGTKGIINLYGGTYLQKEGNSHTAVASIWDAGGVINLYEGSHIQGVPGEYSIYVRTPSNAKATLGIYGGKVSGSGIYMMGSNLEKNLDVTLNMEDGIIETDLELAANVKANISGAPQIKKLTLARGVKLKLTKMGQTEIPLTANGVFTEQTENTETYKNYFVPTNTTFDIVVKDNALYCQKNYAGEMGNTCLVCEKTVTWTAITGGQVMTDGGHYYLSGDLQSTVTAPVSGTACLHLNGHSLAGITGNAGNLNVLGSGNVAAVSMNNESGTMNLYSGTYAAINVNSGKINLFDDAVVSGNVTADGGEINLENAKVQGTVNVAAATFSMYNSNVAKLVATADAKISVSGAPVIGRMELAPLTRISVGQLNDGADIKVLAHHTFTEPNTLLSSYVGFFHPAHEAGKISVVNDALYYTADYLTNQTTACPYCEKDVQWQVLSGATTVQLQDGGHYYLTSNINYTGSDAFLTAPAAGKACVHLSGYNITATNVIAGGAGELSILGNGTVNGAVAQSANGKLNLLGGTYTGSITATAGTLFIHDGAALQGSVSAANADVFLIGAKVSGNLNVENGSLQVVDAAAANVTLSGAPKATLSGKVVISKLTIPEGVLIDLPVLVDGTAVGVSAKGAITAEFEKAEAYNAYFTTEDAGQWIVVRDGGLYEAATINGDASANEQAALNAQYADREAKQGQFHEHAATGGTSDGKSTLAEWKQIMIDKDMDFTTIVDHKQSLHMKLEDWDNNLFIGGSEAQTYVLDKTHLQKKTLHYNMIFSNPKGLEAVVSKFPSYGWDGEHFGYPSFGTATFTQVINEVLAQGGFFTHVHPKYPSYMVSDNPLDYWFVDYTGLEIVTGDGGDIRRKENHAAYELWLDLLDLDKRIYATFGSDSHKLSDTRSLTTFYAGTPAAGKTMADVYVDLARKGDMTAGSVGIRMAMGQTNMGGHTDFAKEDRLVLSVGDYHSIDIKDDHTYRLDLFDDRGLIYSQELTGRDTQYFAFDVSEDARFYRAEIYDVTEGYIVALGNPIWND